MPDNAVCFQYNSKCRRNRSWFKRKCDGIQVIADSAKKMKEISIEQADRMEQVEATAERIAEVVQNNSAAAQDNTQRYGFGIQIKTIRIDKVFYFLLG